MMSFDRAVQEWIRILGTDRVLTSGEDLKLAATATFKTTQQILATLRPGNTEELRLVLRAAAENRVPVYPVSRGGNCGYGSSVPVTSGSVVLDLSTMNRIRDYSEEMGHITVEPGVSFRQVHEYLKERSSGFFLGMPGNPEGSVIGNTLEHGIGSGYSGQRAERVAAMDVVLSSGELIHTGMSRFEEANSCGIYKWGLGPVLDGLFIQSNFGVVTSMTITLMKKTSHFAFASFRFESADLLAGFFEEVRVSQLMEFHKCDLSVRNDLALLTKFQQYPWDEMKGQIPLSEKVRRDLRQKWNFSEWMGRCFIFSPSAEASRAASIFLKRKLGKTADSFRVFDDGMDSGTWWRRPYNWMTGKSSNRFATFFSNYMEGPGELSLQQLYWRKRITTPAKARAREDQCGNIWFCPVVPMRAVNVREYLDLIQKVGAESKFEIGLSFLALPPGTSLIAVTHICYDRELPGEDEAAMKCYERIFEEAVKKGYMPYRLGIQSMTKIPRSQGDYDEVLSRIKSALDPSGILSTGRYGLS